MYTITVRREFDALHFLERESKPQEQVTHPHRYAVAVKLEGRQLDERGYLVDIESVEKNLEKLMTRFQGQTLNDLPEFRGLNPSIEHFSRIFCYSFCDEVAASPVDSVTVIISESKKASASYRRTINAPRVDYLQRS
jgi:6-pyruvoyltetrahydropterin/6-carboxytetrahydropterin synthase